MAVVVRELPAGARSQHGIQQTTVVVAGSEVGLVAAFAAGIASFASPCVLPLVPAYLAIVGGLDVSRVAESARTSNATVRSTSTLVKRLS